MLSLAGQSSERRKSDQLRDPKWLRMRMPVTPFRVEENVSHIFRKLLALAFVVVLAAAFAVPAFAWGGGGGGPGCNSGNGNGSELVGATDCDPGNSGDHNNGGD